MPDLLPCLLNRTATELRSICARLGVYRRTTTTKATCAAAIAGFWLHNAQRKQGLTQLSPQAQLARQRLPQFVMVDQDCANVACCVTGSQ